MINLFSAIITLVLGFADCFDAAGMAAGSHGRWLSLLIGWHALTNQGCGVADGQRAPKHHSKAKFHQCQHHIFPLQQTPYRHHHIFLARTLRDSKGLRVKLIRWMYAFEEQSGWWLEVSGTCVVFLGGLF